MMNEWIISKLLIICVLLIIKIICYFEIPFATIHNVIWKSPSGEELFNLNKFLPGAQMEWKLGKFIDINKQACSIGMNNTTVPIEKRWCPQITSVQEIIFIITFSIGLFSCVYYIICLGLCKKLPGRLILVGLGIIGLLIEIAFIIYWVQEDIKKDIQINNIDFGTYEYKLKRESGYFIYIIISVLLQLVISFMPGMTKCEKENDIIKL
tara:strand:+ start:4 stop:630 length:627 start_codon:yes stop_codon:yes gene_type:complete